MQKRLGQTADRISPAAFHRQQVPTVGRREPVTVATPARVGDALAVRLLRAEPAPAGQPCSRHALESIAEADPREILSLPPRAHQLMEHPEGA